MRSGIIGEVLDSGRIFDLGLPLFAGMPNGPTHPPFMFSLTKLHGEVTYSGGASSANCVISLGSHVGTHVDALAHVSRDGIAHGGRPVGNVQSRVGGLGELGIDQTSPIVVRGILLDIPRLRGVARLDGSDEVTAADLELAAREENVDVEPGDAVLIRTGWTQLWPDDAYQSHPAPGPGLDAAQWLTAKQAGFTGSDTPAYEKTPARGLAVHLALMVDAGVQIMEMLDLEAMASAGVYEFLFVALPLKIKGGTASPIRPIAIA